MKKFMKKMMAGCLAISMMFSTVAAADVWAAEKYVDIDDSVVTTTGEAFKFQYSPENRWYGEAGYPNLFFDGTDHYSDYSNTGADMDAYSMKFSGTGVAVYGSLNVNHAMCDVFIDGTDVGDINAQPSNGTTTHKQLLFENTDLTDGEHTLKVVRKSGDTKAVQVDKVRVYYDALTTSAITLNAEMVRLGVGETKQMTASAEPWVIDAPEIVWSSADENIATVDANGVITAVAEVFAETTVTATAKGSEVSAEVRVVVDPAMEVACIYVGNEQLLETQEDYEALLNGGASDTFRATVWKGDAFNSKINVISKNKALHNVEITVGEFKNEAGKTLAAENFSIKWLKEVKANNGRNMAGVVKSYPDMIYKGGKTDIAAETVKFAWVNVEIPVDTAAGVYTGTLSVTADELKAPVTLTYTIEVLNLEQPAPDVTEIQLWQHPFSVANYYLGLGGTGSICNELANDFYFTEEHFNLMRAQTEEYVELGGHDLVANIVEEAWNHQSYYNDPSMVKWTKNADGTWSFDYTWYDAWVEFGIECGVIDPENGVGKIKCYSIVPWNNQIAYYDAASGRTVKESHTPGTDAWKAIWTPFLEDFVKHSEEKGWFDITYISMDERSMEQLEPTVALIETVKNADGEYFKISSALNYAAPQYYDFTDRIHDISINLGNCNVNQMNTLSEHRRALGLTTTYYTCTGDYPSNFCISDPGDNYWGMWYTMTLGTDGYLRWAWDNYVYDMHGDVSYRYWEPGDGWFIYPVERNEIDDEYNAGFYSTPRYEMLKQGLRDVAKAKYLMEQSEELNDQINELTDSIQRPGKGFVNGSATYQNETQRMLAHSESDRVLSAVNALAKELAPEETPEPTIEPTTEPTIEPTEEPTVEPTETPEAAEDVTKAFSDVYADWYKEYVQYVYDNNLMTGIKGTTRFEPNANITKAQVAQVLYNMEGQPEGTDKSVFTALTDVYAGEWYANAVAWAFNTGVVTGDTNAKKFFPNADVTREQLALMMYRYAQYKAYDVTAASDLAGLQNAENVSNWAADGVKWAVGAGLISGIEQNGVKDLAPQGNASRAQVAAILQRFCEAYE